MRGAAPTAICPRCSAESPPSDQPLITCATCKLSFDPRDEPVARPRRPERKEYEAAPPGFRITREPGELAIAWSFERMKGIVALGFAVFCASMFIGNRDTPGEDWYQLALLAGAVVLLAYVGIAWAFGDTALRVDSRQLTVRRHPLPFGRGIWIGRHEIQEIQVTRSNARHAWYSVVAITPRGAIVLAELADDNHGAKDAASCIADVVREAIDEIPAD